MNVAVRYQSRGGHVKAMAESLAEGAGVEAISVDAPNAALDDHVDLLFIGGAMYKWKLDPSMQRFLDEIPEGSVYKAVVFGSSATTRRPVYAIQEELKKKGAIINPLALFQRGKPKKYLFEIAPPFARDQVKEVEKELAEQADDFAKEAAQAAEEAQRVADVAAKKAAAAAAAAEQLRAAEQAAAEAAEQLEAAQKAVAEARREAANAAAEAEAGQAAEAGRD